jgi:pilus assembly protein Flp/PilA
MKYFKKAMGFIADEEGASAVEYALLVGLIAVAIIAGVTMLGTKINSMFTNVAGQLPTGAAAG